MEFSTTDVIAFPLDTVFSAHRDHLADVVEYLPNVASIEVESREEEDGVVRLVNIWTAERTEVPALLRPFIKPEMLRWIDRANWYEAEHQCRWEIELGFLKDAIVVEGKNHMKALSGDRTEVTVGGRIEVDGRKIPGVPKFMAKKIGSAVESFVVKTITPNLKKTNEGVRAFITAQRAEGATEE